MRIVSWNVNGLRAAEKKGFAAWLDSCGADVVGLQETRVFPEQLSPALRAPDGWHAHFSPAERGGYSGVAFYARRPWDDIVSSLDEPELDTEGRFLMARFGRLTVVTGYFPNGSGLLRDNSRVPYKLRFFRKVQALLEPARHRGDPILVMGDFNVAHREIDIARPRENIANSGFLPVEREELSKWLDAGWIDTYRHLDPSPHKYTWWAARGGARARNVGWRIDYVLASHGVMPFLQAASIHHEIHGSDHCPVSVDLDDRVLLAVSPSAASTEPTKSTSPRKTAKSAEPAKPAKPATVASVATAKVAKPKRS